MERLPGHTGENSKLQNDAYSNMPFVVRWRVFQTHTTETLHLSIWVIAEKKFRGKDIPTG